MSMQPLSRSHKVTFLKKNEDKQVLGGAPPVTP
jgi:hypothetical protein